MIQSRLYRVRSIDIDQERINDMEFFKLAEKRCSVRSYLPREIEKEKEDRILQAARLAPTAHNNQPYRILVIKSKEGLRKLKKAGNVYDAPLAFVICADRSEAWERPFDGKRSTDIDSSIVTTYMMLEATELDLGSIWVCFFDPTALCDEFDIPSELEPINILGVGYPAKELKSPERYESERKKLSEIVLQESFSD